MSRLVFIFRGTLNKVWNIAMLLSAYTIRHLEFNMIIIVIQPEDGRISVIGSVDRETADKYTIIVTANDKGSPPRMVTNHGQFFFNVCFCTVMFFKY